MAWRIDSELDDQRKDELSEQLVAHNVAASAIVRQRFEPEHLASTPLHRFAYDEAGDLVGGCTGRSEDLWHWLTIDLLWVRDDQRGTGLGGALLASVEEAARARGCRWSKVNTWDFQAPEFYTRHGYVTYATEPDYPPGHVNFLMRKDLEGSGGVAPTAH
jgi:GNAT superfamily N-acetyltransferase